MKKYKLQIGLPIAVLIAVLITLPRLVRFDWDEFRKHLDITEYYFIFLALSWLGNQTLINSVYGHKKFYGIKLFYFISIFAGWLFSASFDYLSTAITSHHLAINSLTPDAGYRGVILRGVLFNFLNAFLVFHFKRMEDIEHHKMEVEQLKQANLQANLSSLKEQLSPHFLFNTLNTLASLSTEQPVKEYISELGNVYRYLLSYQHKDHVTLKEELAFCESYLYIVKMRLQKGIEVGMAISTAAMERKIPPLTLQLLIENAIKHNVTAAYKPLKIQISATDDHLTISNNQQPKNSVEAPSGIGLTNISSRYQLIFDRDIIIENKTDFFKVQLPLIA